MHALVNYSHICTYPEVAEDPPPADFMSMAWGPSAAFDTFGIPPFRVAEIVP